MVVSFIVTGCNVIQSSLPPNSPAGGDFYICENLMKGFYTALSNRNFAQALTYCKSGGISFKFANGLWDASQDYPLFYADFDIYNLRGHEYLTTNKIAIHYDESSTTMDIYGNSYNTLFYGNQLMLFEKINGQWLLM
jgi:hypothetical protein